MKKIRFAFYYINLRLKTMLGIHQTYNPLDLKWRWDYWQRKIAGTKRK